ncbi:TRAP transporter small permease [Butyricicoccus faecihominis]|uniref:TRAP transporter small permease n=1 Tax=Butyricicoccus faecihominis TaxID=1712515 RepID=UPI00247AC65D|nr:TRAP transporter small permease [Butyricicoccus faecihominis]MCQ5128438.1 TRAP transporter small permease [Butyricicoccus faecihominis]
MKKFGDILYRLETIVAGTGFVVMVGVITVNVLARFLFSKSFAWAEEIAYLSFNWAVFFGICIVYRNQGLISIDALVSRLPEGVQRAVQAFTFALVGVANIGLIVWGIELSIQGLVRSTPILRIPYFWVDLSVPAAALILGGYSFYNMIKCLKGEKIEEAALEERT